MAIYTGLRLEAAGFHFLRRGTRSLYVALYAFAAERFDAHYGACFPR